MKTLAHSFLFSFTLVLTLSSSFFAEAESGSRPVAAAPYQTGIYSTSDGRLHIALNKQTGSRVDIRLKAADGTVLYSQRLGKNDQTFRTKLNLTELADGTYQLEITNGTETSSQTITLATKQAPTSVRLIQAGEVAMR